MRIWLVAIGEPLPMDEAAPRLLRVGLLARVLSDRGHQVVWWTSSFDHIRKRQRVKRDETLNVCEGLQIEILRGLGYESNVSLRRLIDHAVLGVKFAQLASKRERPDLILAALPTLELAAAACRYGGRLGVPVVVDVRDLWPDVLVEVAPRKFRPLAEQLLRPYRRMARYACSRATAIMGPTAEYVEWGLKHANRPKAPWDREFPFGYSNSIPNAAEISEAEEFWREKGIEAGTDEFIVCFFGTLGRQFDLDTVIEAARSLSKVESRIRFVICGTGDGELTYREKSAGCASILFAGWVGRNEIWSLMKMASAGLAPYKRTPNFDLNIPNKPIEYMSSGLPVVTCLEGALKKLLNDNGCGIFYRAGDPHSLVEALVELASDRERLSVYGANARRAFEMGFSAERVYNAMACFLEDIRATGARNDRQKDLV